jgi:hypothetical protein
MTEFEAVVAGGRRAFPAGTVVVPAVEDAAALRVELRRLTVRDSLDIAATATGRTAAGLDLGSPSVQPLALPRPALVVGDGVSTYEAGEIWYLLDHHYGIELSLLDKDRLGRVDLAQYSHLLMVDGNYRDLDDDTVAAIRRWVHAGGTLVTTQSASAWALQRIVREPRPAGAAPAGGGPELAAGRDAVDSAALEPPAPQLGRYADYAAERAKELVSGAVLEARVDLTHPLAFGYQEETLALFRTASRPMEASDNPYENVALYTAEPWLSGYLSPRNQERLAGTAALTAARVGDGAVIRFADDPFFRAYWRAPSRLYLNALFVGTLLEEVLPPSRW